jgi:hypothetical protein
MAARNKPAGIRPLAYGIGKGKGCIEGLSVSVKRAPRSAAVHTRGPAEVTDFLNATFGTSFITGLVLQRHPSAPLLPTADSSIDCRGERIKRTFCLV